MRPLWEQAIMDLEIDAERKLQIIYMVQKAIAEAIEENV